MVEHLPVAKMPASNRQKFSLKLRQFKFMKKFNKDGISDGIPWNKALCAMKMTIFFFFVSTFALIASETWSQNKTFTINRQNVMIKDVLQEIEDQSGYFFIYNNEFVDVYRKISIRAKDKSIQDLLDEIFQEQDVAYSVNNRKIILTPVNGIKVADQNKSISGKVSDSSGLPLPGVTVVIKGTGIGSITDSNGNYLLSTVPSNAILVFSFIGMKTQEAVVGNSTTLDVVMAEETIGIEEVVAVGYGVQKKVNLSGAVASVNVSELTESRPITNISNALSGLAAGVSVTSASNRPGNDNATILVRGQGTLNNSTPLIIIDGVEAAMNTVNPQDVESISVLKDAASASIYGSRAANGVILITTKKGKKGSIKLEYNGYVSFESIRKTLTPVSNYADYMEYVNEGYANSKLATLFSQEMIDAWRNGTDPLLYPNTDWIDGTFENSLATNHVLSMSGGSDKIRFYSSFGYLNNPGVMENSGQEKYSTRLNIEGEVRPWLKLGANLNGYFSNLDVGTANIENSTGVFAYAAATTPGMVFRAPDGRYGAMNNSEDDPQAANNNPLRSLNSAAGNYGTHNIRTRFFGTLNPFKGFSVTGSYNYDFTDEQLEKTPVFHDGWNFLTNTVTLVGTGKTYVTNQDSKVIRNFWDLVGRYENKFFNDGLNLEMMAGASREQYLSKKFATTRYDLIDSNLTAIDAATGEATSSGSATDWAMHSYFGRLNLGWEDKYLLEFNLRADASSRFLAGNRWGYFPSASVAWRIDQEEFMQSLSKRWLSNLKLRISYGSLGNNSFGDNPNENNYEALSTYAQSNYSWGDAMVVGLAQTALANPNLTWETTYITNIGIDFGAMNNRLTGTIDAFRKRTKDILIYLPAPSVHGTSDLPTQNAATVTNKGIEVTLGWQDQTGDFTYGISGNFTYVKNKVNKFKGDDYSLDGVNYIREGYAIKSQYMLRVNRIVQTDEDLAIVQEMLAKNPSAFAAYGTPEKGDLLYMDTSGDGIINSDDREVVSTGNNPKFLFGLNTSFGYKGFDLAVLLQGVTGVKVYWQQHQYNTPTVHYGYQLNKEVVEGRWYEGRTDATYPRLLQYSDTRNTQASDFYLANKSYVKIRNIQLGYTFPESVIQRLFIDRLRIYGSLENFFTFTSYKGLDPEVSGIAYPSMKQAVVGINVSF